MQAASRCNKHIFVFFLFLQLVLACSKQEHSIRLEFWVLGHEGDAVKALVTQFEKNHPRIKIKVQQIPWSSAHEKLLTANAGDSLPDLFQLGNTWIPEFAALDAIQNLSGLARDSLKIEDFFPGSIDAVSQDGKLLGIPWYIDTRLIFYRKDILASAGLSHPPATWSEWEVMMTKIKSFELAEHYPLIQPMNEWQVPVILGLQHGAELLRDNSTYGNFRSDEFRKAFAFYMKWFRQDWTPSVSVTQSFNIYHEFGQGIFAMYITGPWNIGEFRRRLPIAIQTQWSTAPLPAPDSQINKNNTLPGVSLAGGASIVLAQSSRHTAAALEFAKFLTDTQSQIKFHQLTGNLPSRRSAWNAPELAISEPAEAFRRQLENIRPTPKIPEWERIAAKVAYFSEKAIRAQLTEEEALTLLDHEVDLILEKRRWLLKQQSIQETVKPSVN